MDASHGTRTECVVDQLCVELAVLSGSFECARLTASLCKETDDQALADGTSRAGAFGFALWVHGEQRASISRSMCVDASLHGNLEMLEFAHNRGVSLTLSDVPTALATATLATAAEAAAASSQGHLSCLRYTHEHGCPLTGIMGFLAARKGSLPCLSYLFENGCLAERF